MFLKARRNKLRSVSFEWKSPEELTVKGEGDGWDPYHKALLPLTTLCYYQP